MGDIKSAHQGHRQRLKERFMKGGGNALADYEFIELILFLAKPRGDTKPLAKELIAAYKNIAGVLTAPIDELKRFKNLGDTSITALKLVKEAATKLAQEQILDKPILSSWQLLLDYCHMHLAHDPLESFHILFVDTKNRLIADERHQQGTVDKAFIYPREIVKRALALNASSLILVHNHPSGVPNPSRSDIELTQELISILKPLEIKVHDHVIISKTGHKSFKTLGLI